jgi:hypothetical protein
MLPGVEHRQSRYLKTGVRARINPRVSASVVCGGVRQRVMPSALCLRMDPFANTFGRDGIYCPRPRTAER